MKRRSLPLLFLLALTSIMAEVGLADEISFGDKGTLTGSIETSPVKGTLLLHSPHSEKPLEVKTETVKKISFRSKQQKNTLPHEITFKNGDHLPGTILRYEGQKLEFIAPWQSHFTTEKDQLSSIAFTQSNHIIYDGPEESNWKKSQNCHFEDGAIRYTGSGYARWVAPELPEHYTLICEITWNEIAGFELILANATPTPNKENCYRITFDHVGLQLHRHSTTLKSPITLCLESKLRVNEMREKKLTLALSINRNDRTLQLSANGKIIRNSIIDPTSTGALPVGKHFGLIINGQSSSESYLRKFRLTENEPHLATALKEKRVNITNDSFYDIECNHWSGEIHSIQTEQKKSVLFNTVHSTVTIEAPIARVAKIFFPGESVTPNGKFLISTIGGGNLHVNSFELFNKNLQTQHPSLGAIEIPLSMILEITQP